MTIVAVVGLGYVGLPLAVEFGKKFETIGYDLSEAKIAHYKNYCDPTGEVSTEDLKAATRLTSAPTRASARPTSSSSPCPPRWTKPTSPTSPPWWVLHHRRQAHEEGRHRGVRIHRVSRRHRGSLHPLLEKALRHEVDAGLPRRLLPRAGQPGRQGTHHHQDREGGLRRRRPPSRPSATCTPRSSPPACTGPAASRWPKPPRSSRTPSATSTSP
jgi:hypothetical protein